MWDKRGHNIKKFESDEDRIGLYCEKCGCKFFLIKKKYYIWAPRSMNLNLSDDKLNKMKCSEIVSYMVLK
jgi:hypothetical protein